jgi:hypothetical protein
MTPSAITTQTSQPVPYTDHSQDYVPQTSPWNERRICDYISADNLVGQQKCCSGVKTIDRAIDKAYKNGVQSHLGIKAIQEYPCITQGEMSKLSNDLEKAIKRHGIKMDTPEGLDASNPPGNTGISIIQYCKEVVFEKLSRELGKAANSRPIAFSKNVLKYCQQTLPLRPHPHDPSLYTGW